MSDKEFVDVYYEKYLNTDNNLYYFSEMIGFSYEYIRRKQNRLKLPRKNKGRSFRKVINNECIFSEVQK